MHNRYTTLPFKSRIYNILTQKGVFKSSLVTAYNEKRFFVFNGSTLSNLPDLLDAFRTMTGAQFSHHVSREKNDFALWVEEVLYDAECARNLRHSKNLKESEIVVEKRLGDFQWRVDSSKKSLRRTLSTTASVAGSGLLLVLIFYIILLHPPQKISMVSSVGTVVVQKEKREKSSLPIRLRIPEINIDAVVESVSLTPEGAMGVPENPNNTAWFDSGPRPGEEGSAVIDGHFGWKNGIPAVFDDLSSLHTGDIVYVEDSSGATTVFVVREIRVYGENEDSSGVFSSIDGKAHLNLITCDGDWDASQESYSGRLVVFTDKMME